jgi:2-polyprenyl-3-methyl-5-hydroxy-6-metoxy-1,4-benzoquinol methylase
MEIRTCNRPLCPNCSTQGEVLYKDLDDRIWGIPGKWTIKRCANAKCGMCWLDPVAINEDLPLLYAKFGTHEDLAPPAGLKSKLRTLLLELYEAARFLPMSMVGLRQEKERSASQYLHDLPPGRVLDVGCGDGRFLYRMYQAGWTVAGLDFDPKGIEAAKSKYGKYGFELMNTDLFSARFPDNSFDAVTLGHVIEHVPDPVAILAETKRILKPGGRLVAITPNVESYGQNLFRDCWRDWDPPRHLILFSLASLADCARKATFTRIETKSSAAHADIVFGASFAIKKAREHGTTSRGGHDIELLRGIRCTLMQFHEARLGRNQPDCGEEAVLICHK